MTLTLRPYQQEAVDSIYKYFGNNGGNPLVILPTATGKSLVIADFIRSAIGHFPDTRIIVGTHVKELVAQNQAEFHGLCPEIMSGVYSAGLKSRNTTEPVLFVGIQSVYKRAFELGRCDLLLIDEAHLVPHKGYGMWRRFISELMVANPDMKVIGLTATGYRLDSGILIEGDDRIFTDICYEYPLLDAVRDGYVCEVIPENPETTYDISSVKKRGGEYLPGALERAINIDEKTDQAIDEILVCGADRNSWLIFAAGNDHAKELYNKLAAKGISCALVLQDTPATERDKATEDIKTGRIKCLINNLIYTTGFNAPNIDMIVCFRPTGSAGLWVQIVGRGFRLHPSKKNCLALDFGRNADRHGPLDQISGSRKRGDGDGEAPVKNCPKCHSVVFAGTSICPDCQYEFPREEAEIDSKASTAPILSTQIRPEWHEVISTQHERHDKPGKTSSMRVTYVTSGGKYSEWVCFEHIGYAREKAAQWHRKRKPDMPCPNSVSDALEIAYPPAVRIQVKPDGKYWRISDVELYEEGVEFHTPRPPVIMDIEDDIPF
jgi:DNA repair protein RadD